MQPSKFIKIIFLALLSIHILSCTTYRLKSSDDLLNKKKDKSNAIKYNSDYENELNVHEVIKNAGIKITYSKDMIDGLGYCKITDSNNKECIESVMPLRVFFEYQADSIVHILNKFPTNEGEFELGLFLKGNRQECRFKINRYPKGETKFKTLNAEVMMNKIFELESGQVEIKVAYSGIDTLLNRKFDITAELHIWDSWK